MISPDGAHLASTSSALVQGSLPQRARAAARVRRAGSAIFQVIGASSRKPAHQIGAALGPGLVGADALLRERAEGVEIAAGGAFAGLFEAVDDVLQDAA